MHVHLAKVRLEVCLEWLVASDRNSVTAITFAIGHQDLHRNSYLQQGRVFRSTIGYVDRLAATHRLTLPLMQTIDIPFEHGSEITIKH